MRRTFVAAAAAVALAAGASFAGDSATKVPGVGGAEIKWNDLRYRKQLLDQLQPGLTWRLGVGGPTRIEISGMALAGQRGILFPGESTFNLRFWSWEKWELVAFEENDWKWTETMHQLGVFPVEVWREKEKKKETEKLELTLRSVAAKDRMQRPEGATVTPGAGEKPTVKMLPSVEHSKEALAELEKAPWVQLEMRFGDLIAVASFEAVKAGETKGEMTAAADAAGRYAAGEKVPLRLRFLRHPAIRAKTELAEVSEEVVVGVLRCESKKAPEEWIVSVSGGETPELWRRRLGKDEEMKPLAGKRVAVKGERKETSASLAKNVLTLSFHGLDYVFEL